MGSEVFLIFGFMIVLAIVIRLAAGSFDGERVERYIRDHGYELIDKSWAPFGPGWFGEKDSRIYEIVYKDQEGRIHRAHVKTSMMSGVYLTNDQIIEEPEPALPRSSQSFRSPESIQQEKERLRKR
ncbi:MAG: hypothetical protein ACQKBT_01400, partial [Puniceicoccales bacterium]